jgi:phage replication O-like protein O
MAKVGFNLPNYTQTPNDLFDEMLPDMGLSELKVVLVIIRKTKGWHKERDRISLSQLMKLTGLSRQGVLDGILRAMQRGIVGREASGRSYEYFLIVNTVDQLPSKDSQHSRHTKENNIKEISAYGDMLF